MLYFNNCSKYCPFDFETVDIRVPTGMYVTLPRSVLSSSSVSAANKAFKSMNIFHNSCFIVEDLSLSIFFLFHFLFLCCFARIALCCLTADVVCIRGDSVSSNFLLSSGRK
jgi:hypothetical protein